MTTEINLSQTETVVAISADAPTVEIGAQEVIFGLSFDDTDLTIVLEENSHSVDAPQDVSVSIAAGDTVVEISPIAAGGGGGSSFLPVSDRIDQDPNSAYFYFGWESLNGSWRVRRQKRSTAATEDATIANNLIFANLTSAWPQRETLAY
jgi:hypothetical protein